MDYQPQAVDGNDLSSASLAALLKCHDKNGVVIRFDTMLLSNYVGNVFVQNVAGLRKYVATQDMSDMSQTCHMTF